MLDGGAGETADYDRMLKPLEIIPTQQAEGFADPEDRVLRARTADPGQSVELIAHRGIAGQRRQNKAGASPAFPG